MRTSVITPEPVTSIPQGPVVRKKRNGHDWPEPHLSASQILAYLNCSLRYWFQYVGHIEPAFVPVALPFGSSIHTAVAAFLRSVQAGTPMSAKEAGIQFTDAWTQVLLDNPPVLYDREDFYQLQEKGKAMVDLFCRQFQPQLVLNVEEPFCVTLDPDLPPLVGIIDLVELDEANVDCLIVTDLKTTSRKPTGMGKRQDIQLGLYILALRAQGWESQEIQARYLMLVKTQEPQFQSVSLQMPEGYGDWLISLVKGVWDGISQEVFVPNPSYQCATCPYQAPCQQWRG